MKLLFFNRTISLLHLFFCIWVFNLSGQDFTSYFFTGDSSSAFTIEYLKEEGFIAFDKTGEKLFEIYPFDNGPDYPSEGLFRIIKDDKIGFANLNGEIVIEPLFSAARPFHNHYAAFCEGCKTIQYGEHFTWENGKWGFIHKSGKVFQQPQYDQIIQDFENGHAIVEVDGKQLNIYSSNQTNKRTMKEEQWIELMVDAVHLINKVEFNSRLKVEPDWIHQLEPFGALEKKGISTKIYTSDNNRLLAQLYLLPWQNLYTETGTDQLMASDPSLYEAMVADFAIIFVKPSTLDLNIKEQQLLDKFIKVFRYAINSSELNLEITDHNISIPDELQIIATSIFKNYLTLEVAVPGSKLPSDWSPIFRNRMLHLTLVPDIGSVQRQWIVPSNWELNDTDSVLEDSLLNIFDQSLRNSINQPEYRNNIFTEKAASIEKLFSSLNPDEGYLGKKYINRLKRWLLLEEEEVVVANSDHNFGNYQPKLTPDLATDYMPELFEIFESFPSAEPQNLIRLLDLFKAYSKDAKRNKGYWEEGNIVLGAKQKEYKPSKEELILAEIGDRLQILFKSLSDEKFTQLIDQEYNNLIPVEYDRFTFIHMDVMGSGRFYYVESIEKVVLNLQQ